MKRHFQIVLIFFLFISCSKDIEPEIIPNYNLKVTITPIEGGTVTPNEGTYPNGTTISLLGTPSPEYIFKEWTGGITGTTNPISVTMSSNKNITGVFEKGDELSYKESIIQLRNDILNIIRPPDGKPSWTYSFDLENDGDLDIILIRSGPSSYPKKEMILFKNENNTTFVRINTGIYCWGRKVIFEDFNKDGLIDFFVPDHGMDLPPFPGGQDQLIFQTNDGQLIDKTYELLPQILNFSHGGSSIDLGNDGDKDLIINTGGSQVVLKNDNGVFDFWNEGIEPKLITSEYNVEGNPIIDGVLRTDIWEVFISGWCSKSGDFNNDGFEDLIIGCGFTDLGDPGDSNHDSFRTVDPYDNVLEKGNLILLQDPNTNKLHYKYPQSLVEDSWRTDIQTGGGTSSLLVSDFNNDGCLDFISYGTNEETHRLEINYGNCSGVFEDLTIFELYVNTNGDVLWEDFEIIDIDNDNDMDIIISNSLQWTNSFETSNEHVVLENINGTFEQRNGNLDDLINLPPHVGISWYLDGE